MAICLTAQQPLFDGNGDPVLVGTAWQPGQQCAGVVVATPDEVSPFNIPMSDAGPLAAAITAVWVTGWVFRQLIRTLAIGDRDKDQ